MLLCLICKVLVVQIRRTQLMAKMTALKFAGTDRLTK
jgi:hypothetical protein